MILLLLRRQTPSWGFLQLMYLVFNAASSVCLYETKILVNDRNEVFFFFFFRMGRKMFAYEIVNFSFYPFHSFRLIL